MNVLLTDILENDDMSKYAENTIDLLNRSKRLPIILLIDVSSHMETSKYLLEESIKKLYKNLLKDRSISSSVELSIISFSDEFEIIEKLREIKKEESMGRNINLHFKGYPLTGLALKLAISQIESRKEYYGNSKTKYYTPILFIITGSIPESYDSKIRDIEESAMSFSMQYIKQQVCSNKLVAIAGEVGNKTSHSLMCDFTGLSSYERVFSICDSDTISLICKRIAYHLCCSGRSVSSPPFYNFWSGMKDYLENRKVEK